MVIMPPLPLPAKVNALVFSLYSSAVCSALHLNPLVPPKVAAAQVWPPTTRVSPLGSGTAAADSRELLSEPTSRKVLVAVLKIWALALELVSVARLMIPPSLPPASPPATRMLPASGPGVLVGVAVGVPDAAVVAVAVAVAVGVAVTVDVGVVRHG